MQTTNYKKDYNKKTISPFHQQMQAKVYDYTNPKHPVREAINKNLGSFSLTVKINEDKETLSLFKTPGLVALLCTLEKDGRIVGEGRGSSRISQDNRYFEKSIRYAFNASILDAIAKSVKTLDVLHPNKGEIEEVYKTKAIKTEPITEKQREYLTQLIHSNVADEDTKQEWESNLEDFSRNEASDAIQKFKG